MAKRGVLVHRKTRNLARILGIEQTYALGVLEALWHLAAAQRPRGDVGSLSNQDIADELYFRGDADVLVQALIDAKWLDENSEHRLLVHDWAEHCDDYVHRLLARRGELFACGSVPKFSAMRQVEQLVAREQYGEDLGAASKRSPALQAFLGAYPRKLTPKQKNEAVRAWAQVDPSPEIVASIMAGLELWVGSDDWAEHGGQFVPAPAKFLLDRRWEDRPFSAQDPSDALACRVRELMRTGYSADEAEAIIQGTAA